MTYYCANCGAKIPDEVIKKRRQPKTQTHHCNRQCDIERRKNEGYFQAMSRVGNASQQKYKQEHGVVPGPARGGATLTGSHRSEETKEKIRRTLRERRASGRANTNI